MQKCKHNYNYLPEELRARRQWCVAGPDGKGTYKAPYVVTLSAMASSVNPDHWATLDEAEAAAAPFPDAGIGYMLHESDPYTCIDLDVKSHTTQEELDRYEKIIAAFNSYTEFSSSGKGFHIWVRGKIGAGCRREGVEVYSQGRFIVCTGNVYRNHPIADAQPLLDQLVAEMRSNLPSAADHNSIADGPVTMQDDDIIDHLSRAENGDKFLALYSGDWGSLGYPSQSEADLALMSMFTFYSRNNDQCRRMFRASMLGRREKAIKNDVYLNRTLAQIRARQATEDAQQALGEKLAGELLQLCEVVEPEPSPLAAHPAQPAYQPPAAQLGDATGPLGFPPGFVGRLAQHFYKTAPRPVAEVAIVSALGLMAGICGKAWNIPASGLNLYLVLVGRSAIGKEALHGSISALMHQYAATNMTVGARFVDFTDYASGPALVKAVAANPSFVNVNGEFGRKLVRMANEKNEAAMQQLRTAMTNLYQKSAQSSIVGGIGYSQKENNVASVSGVAYSLIGETTPDKFFQTLTDSMMEDGFLSRFTIIECTSLRPPLNLNTHIPFPQEDFQYFGSLMMAAAQKCAPGGGVVMVGRDEFAASMLDAFNHECDNEINNTDDEMFRQMWNRAHLKALRIAALLAVGDCYWQPVINSEHCIWAINVVRRDIAVMHEKITSGDVGSGDAPREKKLLNVFAEAVYRNQLTNGYGIPTKMLTDRIVPRKFLQNRTQRHAAFTGHKAGATAALDQGLRSLIDSGYIREVATMKLVQEYSFSGKAYQIMHLPNDILRAYNTIT